MLLDLCNTSKYKINRKVVMKKLNYIIFLLKLEYLPGSYQENSLAVD